MVLASVIHQNAAHHLRGDSKEMATVGPLNMVLVHQTKIGFVHEGSCLQCVVYSFALQVAGSQSVEFFVDLRNQLGERILVPIAIALEQQGYVGGGGFHFLIRKKWPMPPCAALWNHYNPFPALAVTALRAMSRKPFARASRSNLFSSARPSTKLAALTSASPSARRASNCSPTNPALEASATASCSKLTATCALPKAVCTRPSAIAKEISMIRLLLFACSLRAPTITAWASVGLFCASRASDRKTSVPISLS